MNESYCKIFLLAQITMIKQELVEQENWKAKSSVAVAMLVAGFAALWLF